MKYLFAFLLFCVAIALVVKGDETNQKVQWVKFRGITQMPLIIAEDATKMWTKMQGKTYHFIRIEKKDFATCNYRDQWRIIVIVSTCKRRHSLILKKDVGAIGPQPCISDILQALYVHSDRERKLYVERYNPKDGEIL
uniref:Cystatin domain-containing protein n=1 Tax=Strongyloides venezuelensis TaxID=75913 RepID=A0A0K0FHW1_STRVS